MTCTSRAGGQRGRGGRGVRGGWPSVARSTRAREACDGTRQSRRASATLALPPHPVDGRRLAEDDGDQVLAADARRLDRRAQDGGARDEDAPARQHGRWPGAGRAATASEWAHDGCATRAPCPLQLARALPRCGTHHAAPITQSVSASAVPRPANANGSMFSSTSCQPPLCSVLFARAAMAGRVAGGVGRQKMGSAASEESAAAGLRHGARLGLSKES